MKPIDIKLSISPETEKKSAVVPLPAFTRMTGKGPAAAEIKGKREVKV